MRPGSSVHPCHSRSKSSPAEQEKPQRRSGRVLGEEDESASFRLSFHVPPRLTEQTFGDSRDGHLSGRAEGGTLSVAGAGTGPRGAGLIQAQECAEGEGESAQCFSATVNVPAHGTH